MSHDNLNSNEENYEDIKNNESTENLLSNENHQHNNKINSKKKKCRLKSFIYKWLPPLTWLINYNVKENLMSDVISGITIGIVQITQG